jgi:hypothetical protein
MYDQNRLEIVLLLLRISVFGVMLLWTVDKFVNPAHGAAVYAHFYFIEGLEAQVMQLIGAAELLILLAFLVGLFKTLSYGAVLLFHTVSTLSTWQIYLDPFAEYHLLFFAAWPMLAACLALFLLREADTLFSLDR